MVAVENAFFYGGGAGAAPTVDSYGRSDNIHAYTSTLPFPDAGSFVATAIKG